MAPIIISGITSLASNILENWNKASQAQRAAQQAPRVEFDSLMKTRSLSGAFVVQPSQLDNTTGALMQQLLSAPEVTSMLAGQNLPPGTNLEIGADGSLALHSANGFTQSLQLRPETQMLAANVRASMAIGH